MAMMNLKPSVFIQPCAYVHVSFEVDWQYLFRLTCDSGWACTHNGEITSDLKHIWLVI